MGKWPQNWKKYSLLRHERVGFLQGAHAVSGAFGNRLVSEARGKGSHRILEHPGFPDFTFAFHCRPTVWTWRALSLEFARRHEGFGGMPIASFLRVVDISFEYRGDAVP
jgi:hypothetical protein